jgi:hypothetical protein
MNMFEIPNPFTQTRIKKAQATFEKSLKGEAEWERLYSSDNEWVDIHSNFSWDTSKEGNSFLRAQRWDGGFRSYRADRGLEIREKQKPSRATISQAEKTFGKAFASSAAKSTLTSLALYGLSFVPGPIGATVRTANAFSKSKLFLSAALAVTGLNVGASIAAGEKMPIVLAETVGGLLGAFTGSVIGKGIGKLATPKFGLSTVARKGPTLTIGKATKQKNFIEKMYEAGPTEFEKKLQAGHLKRSETAKAREALKKLRKLKGGSYGLLGGPGGLKI